MRLRLLAVALTLAAATSCDEVPTPRAQWLVTIGTDAVVPQIGDRLLVEVLDEDGAVCAGCRRQFGVADAADWPISFGVSSDVDRSSSIRARLYRTAITGDDGLPSTDRLIDAFAPLPEPARVTYVGLSLRMACFGVVADPAAGTSCDPATGASAVAPPLTGEEREPEVAAPGTWSLAGPSGCDGVTAPEGMVCVPGGTFLLGAPRTSPLVTELLTVPEQMVYLAPFMIDKDEMTVGELRPLVEAGHLLPPAGSADDGYCTWDRGDDLPVNCLPWRGAVAACAAAGKLLPTEAQWEYVATNLHAETRFPWLDEATNPCDQAVIDQRNEDGSAGRCQPSGEAAGPLPGGKDTDMTLLGVRNMAGNVSEWVLDDTQPYAGDACWGPAVQLRSDPRCEVPDERGAKALKGGSWTKDPADMAGAHRDGSVGASAGLGLRCVQPL